MKRTGSPKVNCPQKMRKYRWFPSAAECSIEFWVIFPFRRFFIMNAWQHHPNMAFLDSASSLCCHESVSVRWLNLSWSWPHFAVQSGRATTSLYPQLHIALKQVTGPSEEEGPMLHDSTSCQRTMKNLFGTTLNPQKYAKLASPSVLFHAWGTHQRGSLPRVGIAFVTLLDTWVDKYQKRVSQCSLRWGERRNLIKSLCMFRLWRRIESMWINKIVCVCVNAVNQI